MTDADTIECHSCGANINHNNKFCGYCGARQISKPKKSKEVLNESSKTKNNKSTTKDFKIKYRGDKKTLPQLIQFLFKWSLWIFLGLVLGLHFASAMGPHAIILLICNILLLLFLVLLLFWGIKKKKGCVEKPARIPTVYKVGSVITICVTIMFFGRYDCIRELPKNYHEGKMAFEDGDWYTAIDLLSSVHSINPEYKDVGSCLEKAKLKKAEAFYLRAKESFKVAKTEYNEMEISSAINTVESTIKLLEKAGKYPESGKLLTEAEEFLGSVRKEKEKNVLKLCSEIEKVNEIVPYTITTCLSCAGTKEGTVDFLLLSEVPVFWDEDAKKGWLIVVVAAVGHTMINNPNIEAVNIYVSDKSLMANRRAYSLPVTLAQNLQPKVHSGKISLEQFYRQINSALKEVKIPQKMIEEKAKKRKDKIPEKNVSFKQKAVKDACNSIFKTLKVFNNDAEMLLFLSASVKNDGNLLEVTVSDHWQYLPTHYKKQIINLVADKYALIAAQYGLRGEKPSPENYPITWFINEFRKQVAYKSTYTGTKVLK